MSNRNEHSDAGSVVLDWCLMLFGLIVPILMFTMLPKIGPRHLFDVTPQGLRLDGIPAFLLIGASITMAFFSLKRIINRYKNKRSDP